MIVITCLILACLVGVALYTLRPQPTPISIETINTEVAQTIQAQLTLDALLTLLPPATSYPATATLPGFTPLPPTSTVTPTPLPPTPTQVLPTPLPPTATTRPVRCNQAVFIKDVTVPDGTSFPPGAEFTKVWRLQNTGSCTWDRNYTLVYVGGDLLGSTRVVPLTSVVQPGQVVDLAVDMIAPDQQGRYKGYWMLANAAGREFGIGSDADEPFWVDIRVIPRNQGYNFDLAVDMCQASWRSSAVSLPCPGNPSSAAGSEVLTFSPVFESGVQENEGTLWTRPEVKVGGWIQGVYPPYTIRQGDQFVSQVGCLKDSQGCEVTFTLDYILPNGTIRNLGQWYEVYDGKVTTIRVDLNSLVGNSVQFILVVTAVNNPSKANAFWFVPSVRHVTPTPTATATRPPNTPTATLTATPTQPGPTPTATATVSTEPLPTATLPVYPYP
ncbi:MAG: hypothetical protein A2W36_01450 [Chloroflexi bacterium RBG_16_58_14]|nr:MAG: hypothetical protein A2W36_01450 [Chloroflexi bacterium RBG_16_58_14]